MVFFHYNLTYVNRPPSSPRRRRPVGASLDKLENSIKWWCVRYTFVTNYLLANQKLELGITQNKTENTPKEWNKPLLSSTFPLEYNFGIFKSGVNKFFLEERVFMNVSGLTTVFFKYKQSS